ncbi:adenosine deaminase AGSA-like [Malaya genurostris]|uniref:adenosine deaminase AGSA-like n=1 Tax=Malaya genurostris TaxID=325434 RepID=UPI0026F3CF47|nr:adenosine deaminase AGSA-like [Malaya genurostris]
MNGEKYISQHQFLTHCVVALCASIVDGFECRQVLRMLAQSQSEFTTGGIILLLSVSDSVITVKFELKKMPRTSFEEFQALRAEFINQEDSRALGSDIVLTEDEIKVNNHIMKLKKAELDAGFKTPSDFAPSRHFFQVLDKIKASPLFQLIQKMPKGAILHAHDTAIGSLEIIVKATHKDHLWQNGDFDRSNPPLFKFSKSKPDAVDGCEWRSVSAIRREIGNEGYDQNIRRAFSLYNEDPLNAYHCINHIWGTFAKIFISLEPIVTYRPIWEEYFYQSLVQLHADNVSHLEFRGILPELYDLENRTYGPEEVVQIYYDLSEKFKKEHPDFIGIKLIYAPHRLGDDETFNRYLDIAERLHKKFPTFVAGFDLVGQEDLGRPHSDFNERLLKMSPSIQFFFHAGETNWNYLTDENLIDAILLGTKRIGHGFAAIKHPRVLEEIKKRNICIELNPISNQVLKLVDDFRNHPGSYYFSDNYPVVVSSDDPAFWCASPLSHDFYIAFLGLASARQDLRLLKKLALNSLEYSAMMKSEKTEAKHKWNILWNSFIDQTVKSITP